MPDLALPSAVGIEPRTTRTLRPIGMALDHFAVAGRRFALDLDGLAGFERGEVGVLDADEEAFAGLDFLDAAQLALLAGQGGADVFQGGDGPAVVALLEMAQTDVVIGLVHLGADGKVLDHVAHDLEALAEISGFIETDAHLERGRGPLCLVGIVFPGRCLEMGAGAVVSPLLVEEITAEAHVSIEAVLAARIAFDDRLPDLDRLGGFFPFQTVIAGLEQIACRLVLDKGTAWGLVVFLVLVLGPGQRKQGNDSDEGQPGAYSRSDRVFHGTSSGWTCGEQAQVLGGNLGWLGQLSR